MNYNDLDNPLSPCNNTQMTTITLEKQNEVIAALKANPMRSDRQIAVETGVSGSYVRTVRIKEGLWTSRRIRFRGGKPHVYYVAKPDLISDDQCLDTELSPLNVSDAMLRQLHALSTQSDGRECYNLIQDILEIAETESGNGSPSQ